MEEGDFSLSISTILLLQHSKVSIQNTIGKWKGSKTKHLNWQAGLVSNPSSLVAIMYGTKEVFSPICSTTTTLFTQYPNRYHLLCVSQWNSKNLSNNEIRSTIPSKTVSSLRQKRSVHHCNWSSQTATSELPYNITILQQKHNLSKTIGSTGLDTCRAKTVPFTLISTWSLVFIPHTATIAMSSLIHSFFWNVPIYLAQSIISLFQRINWHLSCLCLSTSQSHSFLTKDFPSYFITETFLEISKCSLQSYCHITSRSVLFGECHQDFRCRQQLPHKSNVSDSLSSHVLLRTRSLELPGSGQ